jgi:hypothetical protein
MPVASRQGEYPSNGTPSRSSPRAAVAKLRERLEARAIYLLKRHACLSPSAASRTRAPVPISTTPTGELSHGVRTMAGHRRAVRARRPSAACSPTDARLINISHRRSLIVSEPRQFTMNIVGAIDLEKLRKLEGQFGVPKLEIDEK